MPEIGLRYAAGMDAVLPIRQIRNNSWLSEEDVLIWLTVSYLKHTNVAYETNEREARIDLYLPLRSVNPETMAHCFQQNLKILQTPDFQHPCGSRNIVFCI